jgi:hypothetical protein
VAFVEQISWEEQNAVYDGAIAGGPLKDAGALALPPEHYLFLVGKPVFYREQYQGVLALSGLGGSLAELTEAPDVAKAAQKLERSYREELKAFWPGCNVRHSLDLTGKTVSVQVIAEEWDFEKETSAYQLRSKLWPADLPEDWFVNVTVTYRVGCDGSMVAE